MTDFIALVLRLPVTGVLAIGDAPILCKGINLLPRCKEDGPDNIFVPAGNSEAAQL